MAAEVTYRGMTEFFDRCDTAEIGTFYLDVAAFFSNLRKAAWLIGSTLSTET